jgi:hypothetical protein
MRGACERAADATENNAEFKSLIADRQHSSAKATIS